MIERLKIGAAILGTVVLVVGLLAVFVYAGSSIQEFETKCEATGGIPSRLRITNKEHTRRFLCLRKEAVIEVGNE